MSTNPLQNPTPLLPAEAYEVGWGPSRMLCPAHLSLLREIFQMFVSSRCSGVFPPDGDMSSRLVSCSGSQLTAWAWQALVLPYSDCQEPNPHHTQWQHQLGQEGLGRGHLETLLSLKRTCPVSCLCLFLVRQKLETRNPSLM